MPAKISDVRMRLPALCYTKLIYGCEDTNSNSLQVHKQCQDAAEKILNDFKPNLMVAIGGGGYVPARILRYADFHARVAIARTDNIRQIFP
jgi:hypothetical protein